ncbi:homocysteine S-methyltransferase family protein [Marinovum sp.]|uniref:homocysteine S-methyltransferase family protein n=1 Tax=Marinovum sp. TaxID=2024839 RepID=UPI002B268C45|nr:homocysteine S-methyltransferase family protein [Marinovum sp.]
MTEITLLDGGMGQELVQRAGDRPTALWSTQVMRDHPGLVAQVHADFFAAGATLATANTYAILRDRLIHAGIEDQFADLHDRALTEAETARAAHGSGRIAGALGPIGASYRPDLHPDPETAQAIYREIAALHAPRVDLMICETVASLAHASDILTATVPCGKPVWLACTVDDEDGRRLRSGEPVREAARRAADLGAAAILANCSAPEAMPAALDAMASADLPTGAYANGFTQITKDFLKANPTVDALSARRDMGPEPYADHALGWLDHGASILGGCCEVGPAHIAEIAHRLKARGHTLT